MKKLFFAAIISICAVLSASAQQPAIDKGPADGQFTFVQIADPQLGYCSKAKDLEFTVDNYRRVIDIVNDMKPAFVVVSGDMVHRHKNKAHVEAYRQMLKRFDPSIPVFHIPGNHDMPKMEEGSVKQYMDQFGYDRFSFEYGGYAFIGFNSNPMVLEGEAAQKMAKEEYQWLEKQLKQYKGKPIFVFVHHPLTVAEGTPIKHKSAWDEPWRTDFAKLMAKYGVKAIFAGHTHYGETNTIEGIPVYTVGASSHPLYGAETGIQITSVASPTSWFTHFQKIPTYTR